jgi:hypothetical protein
MNLFEIAKKLARESVPSTASENDIRTNYKLISELTLELEQIEMALAKNSPTNYITGVSTHYGIELAIEQSKKDYKTLLQDYNELRNKLDYELGYIPLNNHMLYFLDRDGLDMTNDEYLTVYNNTQTRFKKDINSEPEIAISLGHTEDSVRNIVDRECITLDEEDETEEKYYKKYYKEGE